MDFVGSVIGGAVDAATGKGGALAGEGKDGGAGAKDASGLDVKGGDQGTGLLDSLTKEVVKNKDAIVKTASNTLNLNAGQTEAMSKVFEMFDEGKNGTVSKDKLGDVLRALGENPTEDEVKELEEELCSKDGVDIEMSKLTNAVGCKFGGPEEREKGLKEAFKVFDKDGSGTLSADELREIMTEKGKMRLTHQEVDEMISEVDRDKDGKLNYAEFVRIFSSE